MAKRSVAMNKLPNNIKERGSISSMDFWDSLYAEILCSNLRLTKDDLKALIEHNIMFSIFFRTCSQKELLAYKTILNIKDNCYLILMVLDTEKSENDYTEIGVIDLHNYIKSTLSDYCNSIGPLIDNRISILISTENAEVTSNFKCESKNIAKKLISGIEEKFNISSFAGIGNVYNINSIYKSFIDSLTCLPYGQTNEAVHIQDLENQKRSYLMDYSEAEKRMLSSIILGKREANDYFSILINQIAGLNEDMQRNRILELLILISYTIRSEGLLRYNELNYIDYFNEAMELKGDELIKWFYSKFLHITGYIKPQHSIDYSNKVVQATKEFLEVNYMEDISLEDVAQYVNISPQYFSKLIKKNTGFNFIDWLSMLRVKKAKELLLNTNLTIKEICYRVGYKDPNYFSRIFKKRTGLTPSEFIKKSSRNTN